jgi:hypothetical protein
MQVQQNLQFNTCHLMPTRSADGFYRGGLGKIPVHSVWHCGRHLLQYVLFSHADITPPQLHVFVYSFATDAA